jgi:hypothetical protein
MSRSLVLAGLLVDAWRDQSSHTEPSVSNLPGGAIPMSRFRAESDSAPSAPPLTSLIMLGAAKWESHQGELP